MLYLEYSRFVFFFYESSFTIPLPDSVEVGPLWRMLFRPVMSYLILFCSFAIWSKSFALCLMNVFDLLPSNTGTEGYLFIDFVFPCSAAATDIASVVKDGAKGMLN